MPLNFDDGSMSVATIAGAEDGLVPAASNDGPLAKSSKSKSEKTKTCELQLQLSGVNELLLVQEDTLEDVAALCAVTTTLAAAAGSVSAMFTDTILGNPCGLSGLATYPFFVMQSEPELAPGSSIGDSLKDTIWNLTFSVSKGECSDVATVLGSMFTADSDLSAAISLFQIPRLLGSPGDNDTTPLAAVWFPIS